MDSKKMTSLNPINRLLTAILVVLAVTCTLVISVLKLHATTAIQKHDSLGEFTAHLDERIPALMKAYDIPGATIALVQKGRMTWSGAYGYADRESGRKMTTDTYCRVESISKSVTAWGVMKLARQGIIELDKPVANYLKSWRLPESPFSEEKATVRQLLIHTAGMPLGDFMERYPPQQDIPSLKTHLSKAAVLIQEPGSPFSYSNTGYNLLELLIEEVTGRDFAEYMEHEVLVPLGMTHSSFIWSEAFQPAVPVGYGINGSPIPVYVYPGKASGGLFASVGDIAAFAAAGMIDYSPTGRGVLTPGDIRQLYTPMVNKVGVYSLVFDSYGMGHYLETLPNGNQAVVNGGQGGGVMTFFEFVPETGDGLVLLTNSQRSWPFFGYVMDDWAKWCGFGSVGMSKIIGAQTGLWVFIGLIGLIIVWQAWALGRGLISSRRRFAPLSKHSRLLRLIECCISVTLLSVLLWCLNQDYLFISSVFPIASGWLGLSVFLFAAALLLSAMFPWLESRQRN